MPTILEDYDKIKDEFGKMLADKKVSFAEVTSLIGAILDSAVRTMDKIRDLTNLEALIVECEELYDSLLDAASLDIPRIPEWLEVYLIKLGRGMIRPAILKLADMFTATRLAQFAGSEPSSFFV